MQFKEALKLKGKSLAVIPPWKYAGKQYKTVNTVAENSIVRAKLVSEEGYVPTDSYSQRNAQGTYDRHFTIAGESYRVKSLLFETEGNNDPDTDNIRFVIRASEVVGEWDEVDQRFVERRAEREHAQTERERQHFIIERAEQPLKATLPSTKEKLSETVSNLLGKAVADYQFDASLHVSGAWVDPTNPQEYIAHIAGKVSLDVRCFQQLLEDFYDAREELADLREQVADREEVNA
ncbi:hypothetical protein UFOVP221_31 [uncultured Caudovirales phage]|uniref:Uncharacterized protein n=1 Tax=uncultured Caudovirales phage TaxID=2100421 RepID=A0A6J7WN08_9CAUD|nr:hypothetical protein UFOVP221_31 [uncultured Caudovirales phage]